MFVHDTLLEAVSSGNTEVHARNLLHHIKKLTELGKGEVTGLEEEFKVLKNIETKFFVLFYRDIFQNFERDFVASCVRKSRLFA